MKPFCESQAWRGVSNMSVTAVRTLGYRAHIGNVYIHQLQSCHVGAQKRKVRFAKKKKSPVINSILYFNDIWSRWGKKKQKSQTIVLHQLSHKPLTLWMSFMSVILTNRAIKAVLNQSQMQKPAAGADGFTVFTSQVWFVERKRASRQQLSAGIKQQHEAAFIPRAARVVADQHPRVRVGARVSRRRLVLT